MRRPCARAAACPLLSLMFAAPGWLRAAGASPRLRDAAEVLCGGGAWQTSGLAPAPPIEQMQHTDLLARRVLPRATMCTNAAKNSSLAAVRH